MTVENISWSISTKECCRPRRGLNPRPPGLQSDGASNWATEAGSSLDVVPDILSGPISYTCRRAHMQVEDFLEMIACLRIFKLPTFGARGELALGFWWHINPHVAYKKLKLQCYFLARDHFYICDKAHGPSLSARLCSRFVCDEMAVTFLETCSQEAGRMLGRTLEFSHPQHLVPACHTPSHHPNLLEFFKPYPCSPKSASFRIKLTKLYWWLSQIQAFSTIKGM